ncbi:NmrA family NAD(P)-binding protein [Cryobacterium sp. SO2]|uniref:NmrA family NAD(P)-binding protein n=1 Tax=Cryobacterium sp. SO2 TaxID=1897060 RepID=UPI00223C8F33|nr:NmrA family NAD(P)-binding protein [Cryobacterium sp. SO2]WEO76497.1 NmrA family NAD(P)-binding protein [Cryobacterium sp. SO2]
MTEQSPPPRRPAPRAGVLVTGASGTVGRAVVDALAAAGETVVAGMRDPRAWIAEGARRASGTATGQQPGGPGSARPGAGHGTGQQPGGPGSARPGTTPVGGKPLRAPNQKPYRNPAHKPGSLPATSAPHRTVGRPAAAGPGRAGGASAAGHAVDGSGTTVRAFDFADRGTWARALAGVDRVFLTLPPTVGDVGRTLIPFIDQAMEESGVRQIVFLSAPGARFDNRSPHHLVEQYLKRTRTPYTILRPNVIMQTLSTRYRDDIRLRDEIVLPAANAKAAFVDANDVGRAAARVLTAPGHLRKVYFLAGEQAVGFAQVAQLLTEVLGRPVRYTATTEAEYRELAAKQGATPPDIAAQTAWYRAMRRRLVGFPNRSIRRLADRPATTLRDFVEEHRQTWL